MNDTATDTSYRVTADELRQFVEKFERIDAEIIDLKEEQKEVISELKGRGYDVKAFRTILKLRKMDSDDLAEQEAILEMYKEALGM